MAISAVLLKIFSVSLENRVEFFWVPVKFKHWQDFRKKH